MKRLNAFTDRHPVISMAVGWVLYFAIVLAFYPADPAGIPQFHFTKDAT